jgi:hypothetical protein
MNTVVSSLRTEFLNAAEANKTYYNNLQSNKPNTFYQTLQYYDSEVFLTLAGAKGSSFFLNLTQYTWYLNTLAFLFSNTGEYVEIGLASLLVIYMFSGSSKPAVK